MFDLTSSKLLIIGIMALLVVGPRELPALLRTVGKYVGIIRRQANEFRAQFEEAMRESELDQLKKEVETLGQETESSLRDASQSVTSELHAASADIDKALTGAPAEHPAAAALVNETAAPPDGPEAGRIEQTPAGAASAEVGPSPPDPAPEAAPPDNARVPVKNEA